MGVLYICFHFGFNGGFEVSSSSRVTHADSMHRAESVIVGVLINTLSAFLAYRLGLPLYLDTIGTIAVTAIGGLFPGIITAAATNLLCCLFNSMSLYYVLINILIAIFTAWFVRAGKHKVKALLPLYLCVIAFLGGFFGLLFQWLLLGGPQFDDISQAAEVFSERVKLSVFSCAMILNIGLNLVDKSITAGVAFIVVSLLPEKLKTSIRNSVWKQKPLSDEEIMSYRRRGSDKRFSLKQRLTVLLVFAVVSMSLVMVISGLSFYYRSTREKYTEAAESAAQFAASVINGDHVERYLADGARIADYDDEEYRRINSILISYYESIPSIVYLYVYEIADDGCHVVFDTDPLSQAASSINEVVPFDPTFVPYLEQLKRGEHIEVLASNDSYGYLLTAYEPIYDSYGNVVAYAGADASMDLLTSDIWNFIFRMALIFSGFIILIIACGLWVADYSIVFPIKVMARTAGSFVSGNNDQKELDEHVRIIRSLDIHTQDEMEDLYQSISGMASEMAEQMRDIRHYMDTTTKMQSGLINTMADMVESRDSDTGAHVQKTAAYVRIILEGLKRKGYYSEKLTTQYMNAVEMSAPLHDVGKINISDAILNKPGKLTDEEYTIMKTHTTAGKHIMEKAISTVRGESYLKEARNMAAYHHERWDGKGYPEGLHGEVIPLSARVMAVADVFDALTSPRVYKPAFPVEKALEMLQEGAGTQFDAKCVEVFMDSLPEVKAVLKKYHNM